MYYMSEESKLLLSILIMGMSVLVSYLLVVDYIKKNDKKLREYRVEVVLVSGQRLTFIKTLSAYYYDLIL